MRVGVTGDTHDVIRPELLAALQDVDLILHTGDVCRPDSLEALQALAPVHVVRGNNDTGPGTEAWPLELRLQVAGLTLHMIHARDDLTAVPTDVDLLLFGHSHRPGEGRLDGVPWLNPGSPGRRRFSLPVTCALLDIAKRNLRTHFIDLVAAQPKR